MSSRKPALAVMLALAGALLILHADGWVSVALALVLLCLVAARAWLLHRPQPDASAG